MNFSRSNNTKQEVNVNTNFYTSYSDTALVMAGGWNTQLSLKVKPCIGQDANGIRQYAEDRSQIITTSITPENAICLVQGFDAEVMSAINGEKTAGSVSVVMGSGDQRKVLTIGYNNGNAYLAISVALDESGKAGATIYHKFAKKSYISDYNPSTGHSEEKVIESDLFNFMDKVRAVKDLAPVVAHSIKYNDMSRAAFSPANNAGSFHSNQQTSVNTGYQAPVSTSTDMDFLPF